MPKFLEHIKRSVAKAITYRAASLIIDGLIVFIITKRYDLAIGVVLISNFSSLILYVIHERVWNHISWGKHHTKITKKRK